MLACCIASPTQAAVDTTALRVESGLGITMAAAPELKQGWRSSDAGDTEVLAGTLTVPAIVDSSGTATGWTLQAQPDEATSARLEGPGTLVATPTGTIAGGATEADLRMVCAGACDQGKSDTTITLTLASGSL